MPTSGAPEAASVTSQGSALPTFKAALISSLASTYTNTVSYDSPMSLSDALGLDGSGESVFWLDECEASYELTVIHANHLRFDEVATPTLVIQCVGRTTDTTQQTLDARAAEIQFTVFSILAGDPNVLIGATTDLHIVRAIPSTATITTGIDSQNQRGVRIELGIRLEARIVSAP